MGSLVKGDVVIVYFPFSDMSAGKRRPVVVISTPTAGKLRVEKTMAIAQRIVEIINR